MLAMETLDIPEGSEVITPALTFSTTVSYIIRNKLIPVFVDVKEGAFYIDENKIKSLITKKTKYCCPSSNGKYCKLGKINNVKKKRILIIEDSADTLGATYKNKPTGHYADISITSFYGSHIINCAGNGGMVCFNDKKKYIKAKLLRSWGRSSSLFDEKSEKIENRFNIELDGIQYDKKFVFEKIGHNLEPSELGAAFGLVQLKKLKIYKKLILNYIQISQKYKSYFILPKQLPKSRSGWLAYPITIMENAPFSRTQMQIFLEKKNIQTRVVFTGNILRQPGFKNIKAKKDNKGYPEADKVMRNGILIACHHGLTKKMINHIHKSIDEFMSKYI